MKKLIAIAALASASAMAAEVGVYTQTGGAPKEVTVTVGNEIGYVGVSAGKTQDRLAVGREFEVAKIGNVSAFVGGEVAFLSNASSANGYAVSPFVGAEYQLTKKISTAVIVSKQFGQDRVKQFDGTTTFLGLRYSL